jgi:TolB-like protein
VGIAYVVIGWLLAQIAELAFDAFGAPDWVLKSVLVMLLLGLPLVLFIAWAFEITPEGVKLEKNVDRSQSITRQTGRKLDFIIIGVLVVAVGLLLVDKFLISEPQVPSDEIIATETQSIAVLPFVNMSDDTDYFADGLSEELLNLLAKIPDLKVAGRTSSFAFKGINRDLREVGEALDVSKVLEGSVRRSGERLRVTAQLINVADGYHIWSETYNRQMADIFDIQDDVAGSITDALRLQFTSSQERLTDNTDAYSLYLQALALMNTEETGDLAKAQSFLDQAISLDSTFAKAYELKAMFFWFEAAWTLDAPAAQLKTYDAAIKALELDPSLPGARSFAATANPENWSWINEIRALERFVKEDPENIMGFNALQYDLILVGYFNEAIAYTDRMIELEPLATTGYWRRGEALLAAGRREEAYASWRRAAELGDSLSMFQIAGDLLQIGDDEVAAGLLERAFEVTGFEPADPRNFIENVRAPGSGKTFLDAWIEQAVARATNVDELRRPYFWYLMFGYLDDYWNAIDLLDDPVAAWTNSDTLEHQGMMYVGSGYRQHPRYIERARSEGVTNLWDERGPPDHCSKESGEWICE